MTAFLLGVPLLALAAVLQSTVLSRLPLFGGTLDLVLLMTLGWTLAGEWQGGTLWGFVGGLCLDLLSGGPLGLASLGMVLMAFLASLSEGRFWRSHVLLPLATSVLGTLGFHAVYLVGLSLSGVPVNLGVGLARAALPAALLNSVCMLPIYHALRWLHTLVYPPPVTI
jgi:rod shape-determining protein MreD